MTPERITAEDVRVGDRIARARGHEFLRVVRIDEGPVTRRFHRAGNIRRRRTAKLWRLTDDAG